MLDESRWRCYARPAICCGSPASDLDQTDLQMLLISTCVPPVGLSGLQAATVEVDGSSLMTRTVTVERTDADASVK